MKRFFHLDDDGHVTYLIVAVDLIAAKEILRSHGVTFGQEETPLDDATSLTWTEMTPEQVATKQRCHTEDERGVIALADANVGDWFSSEW
jgi:hypothetical protein